VTKIVAFYVIARDVIGKLTHHCRRVRFVNIPFPSIHIYPTLDSCFSSLHFKVSIDSEFGRILEFGIARGRFAKSHIFKHIYNSLQKIWNKDTIPHILSLNFCIICIKLNLFMMTCTSVKI
jgi:hypothetical protein